MIGSKHTVQSFANLIEEANCILCIAPGRLGEPDSLIVKFLILITFFPLNILKMLGISFMYNHYLQQIKPLNEIILLHNKLHPADLKV